MTGRNRFRDLTGDFPPERRRRVEARKAELRAAMPLHELRCTRVMNPAGDRRGAAGAATRRRQA